MDHIVALQSELSVVPLCRGMPQYLGGLRVYEVAGFSLTTGNLSSEPVSATSGN